MLTFRILPVVRRSHRTLRVGVAVLSLGLLVFQPLVSPTRQYADATQSMATVGDDMAVGMAMHSATHTLDRSAAPATEFISVDLSGASLPAHPLACFHAAMANSCHSCALFVLITIAIVPTSTSDTDGPFPSLRTVRSQSTIAPDDRPPNV